MTMVGVTVKIISHW